MHAIEGTISRFSEGTNNAFALESLEPPMSQLGHFLPISAMHSRVRSTSTTGLFPNGAARQLRAKALGPVFS